MPRPYTFDREAAIEAAMQVFWREGYDGAGLHELLDAMGILRGSLYKAFGSKKDLFLRALERYVATHVDPGIELLTNGTTPGHERIARFFQSAPLGEPRGCLLCNTAAGKAGTDEEVRAAVAHQLKRLRTAFEIALADEIHDPVARHVKAERLTREYVGARVEARAGAGGTET